MMRRCATEPSKVSTRNHEFHPRASPQGPKFLFNTGSTTWREASSTVKPR